MHQTGRHGLTAVTGLPGQPRQHHIRQLRGRRFQIAGDQNDLTAPGPHHLQHLQQVNAGPRVGNGNHHVLRFQEGRRRDLQMGIAVGMHVQPEPHKPVGNVLGDVAAAAVAVGIDPLRLRHQVNGLLQRLVIQHLLGLLQGVDHILKDFAGNVPGGVVRIHFLGQGLRRGKEVPCQCLLQALKAAEPQLMAEPEHRGVRAGRSIRQLAHGHVHHIRRVLQYIIRQLLFRFGQAVIAAAQERQAGSLLKVFHICPLHL